MASRFVLRVGMGLAAIPLACADPARPWTGDTSAPPAVWSGAPLAAASSSDAARSAPSAVPEAPPSAAPAILPDPDLPRLPFEPGGIWIRCAEGFTASNNPLVDVTRLGLLCGPITGLRRRSTQPIVGLVAQGELPVTTPLHVQRGACYRVIFASEPQVTTLRVVVRSGRDSLVASIEGSGRWGLLQPDRPFCAIVEDQWSLDVSAVAGAGRFAAEVWAIGEKRRRASPEESE